VRHTFKEGMAGEWWGKMMQAMSNPIAMKGMTEAQIGAGFFNHSYVPSQPGADSPMCCLWEAKEDISTEAFQDFIDNSPAGPSMGALINTVYKVAPGGSLPPAKFPKKKGYVYGFVDFKDMQAFKTEYSPIAEPTLVPYGGKFVMKHFLPPPMAAKMGMKESKGFGTTGQMAFMLQFADFDTAMAWFTGPEYAAVIKKRDEVADFKMAVVEGEPIGSKAGMVMGFFDMKDPAEFKGVYSPMAEPTLDPYGGKFAIKYPLVAPLAEKMGVKPSAGFGTTGQMGFCLQFETFEKAMGWFTGPEYAAVLTKRDEVADFKMAVVEAFP